MGRPRLISPCVADRYLTRDGRGKNERIAEFSFGNGAGGLISLRTAAADQHIVEIYRAERVIVRTRLTRPFDLMLQALEEALPFVEKLYELNDEPPAGGCSKTILLMQQAIQEAKAIGQT